MDDIKKILEIYQIHQQYISEILGGNCKLPCPRCGACFEFKYGALSRRADVRICSSCGTSEAISDLYGKKDDFNDWILWHICAVERGSYEEESL